MVTRFAWWPVITRAREVFTVIERTHRVCQRKRIHITEGTTIDLQISGFVQPTTMAIGERSIR